MDIPSLSPRDSPVIPGTSTRSVSRGSCTRSPGSPVKKIPKKGNYSFLGHHSIKCTLSPRTFSEILPSLASVVQSRPQSRAVKWVKEGGCRHAPGVTGCILPSRSLIPSAHFKSRSPVSFLGSSRVFLALLLGSVSRESCTKSPGYPVKKIPKKGNYSSFGHHSIKCTLSSRSFRRDPSVSYLGHPVSIPTKLCRKMITVFFRRALLG